MSDLKPCPFCGNALAFTDLPRGYANSAEGHAQDCFMLHSDSYFAEGDEALLLAWNRRASPVDERERALRVALEALYTFPGVKKLLAPKGSLGSIRDLCDDALSAVPGGERDHYLIGWEAPRDKREPPAEPCPTCDGSGMDTDGKDHEADCPTCGRKG